MANHPGTIRKITATKWRAQIFTHRDQATGNQKFKTATFTSKPDAVAWLHDQAALKARGTITNPGTATVRDLGGAWLVHQERRQAVEGKPKANTLAVYRWAVNRHILAAPIADKPIRAVTAADLEGFYAAKADHGRTNGEPMAARTLRQVHIALNSMFRFAVYQGWLDRSPMDRVQARPVKQSASSAVGKVWSADQLRRFLEHTADDRLGPAYRLLAVTGCRRGELLALRWSDYQPRTGRLTISRAWVMVGGSPKLNQPKTGESARTITLDPDTRAVLKAWRKTQTLEMGEWGDGYQDHGLIVCRENGTPIRPDHFAHLFQESVKAAGLPRITPHGLRHTLASLMLQDTPVKVVSELLGHADTATTLETYQSVMPGMSEAAVINLAAKLR